MTQEDEDAAKVREAKKAFNNDIPAINSAIQNSDTDYVRNNWQGVIAKNWQNLTQQQTESLNLLYNGG